jgi:hypothetical protein
MANFVMKGFDYDDFADLLVRSIDPLFAKIGLERAIASWAGKTSDTADYSVTYSANPNSQSHTEIYSTSVRIHFGLFRYPGKLLVAGCGLNFQYNGLVCGDGVISQNGDENTFIKHFREFYNDEVDLRITLFAKDIKDQHKRGPAPNWLVVNDPTDFTRRRMQQINFLKRLRLP